MEQIYSANSDTEITVYLDPAEDLRINNELLDDSDPDLSDDEFTARRAENERRIDVWGTALRAALGQLGAEHNVTIWVCNHPGNVTPGYDRDGEQTLAGRISQAAQDRGHGLIPDGQEW